MKNRLSRISVWYSRLSPALRFTLPLVLVVAAVILPLAFMASGSVDEKLRLKAKEDLGWRLHTVVNTLNVATEAGRRSLENLDPLARERVNCRFARDPVRRETVADIEVPVLSCAGVPVSRNATGLAAFASDTGNDSFLLVRNWDAFIMVAHAEGARARGVVVPAGSVRVVTTDPGYQALISGRAWSGPLHYGAAPGTARLIPLTDSSGEVIGALGFFKPLVESSAGLVGILNRRGAGRLGYFFAIDAANGSDRGHYVFKHTSLEGDDILKASDASVVHAGQQMLERHEGAIYTAWPHSNGSPGSPSFLVPALIAYQYVPEWNWVVATAGFEQDYLGPASGIEHEVFLLGLLGVGLASVASAFMGRRMLRKAGVALGQGESKEEQRDRPGQEELERCSTDLTRRAREGRLDPVVGRDAEIERSIQILLRRSKNNPVLIGEPGVGKTAIVEGLAQRIVAGRVPVPLLNKRVISLDLAMLVAGTKYRGEFEARIKDVLATIIKDPDIILFVDELHMLVGAGKVEGGVLDAGNIMKPALARGELRCIGATTLGEWRFVETDPALERRFQRVMVDEPSVVVARDILAGLRASYANHHGVEITDEAIAAAVDLSHRYITGRFLPDKAIDLIDEAASTVKSKADSGTASGEEALPEAQGQGASRPQVKAIDVARVVARATGIPMARLTENQTEHLLDLEPYLRQRVIGQDHVIAAVTHTLRRSYVGLGSPTRPFGAFLLTGPRGVGKTELAHAVAEFLFGSREALVRIDLSEYGQAGAVASLIGGVPGPFGQAQAGRLTEPVRWSPYRVLLLEQIERAHPEIQDVIRQFLERGYLVDGKGHRVDFTNTVVLITRGADAQYAVAATTGTGQGLLLDVEDQVDAVCRFLPLERSALRQIAGIKTQALGARLVGKGIRIEVTEDALDLLAEMALFAGGGAHGVQHAVETHLAGPLAGLILARKPGAAARIVAQAAEGRIALEIAA